MLHISKSYVNYYVLEIMSVIIFKKLYSKSYSNLHISEIMSIMSIIMFSSVKSYVNHHVTENMLIIMS